VKLLPAAFLLLFALACSPAKGPGRVEGRVTWEDRGVAAALVEAYARPEQDRASPPVAETPSGEDGSFALDLPAGRYWIWAKATVQGAGRDLRLVGQARENPVVVTPGAVQHAAIPLSDPSGFARAAGPAGAGVRGHVATGAAVPAEVTVYAYPGLWERPLGPGFAAATAPGDDGSFQLDLVPGPYTLAARRRASGQDFGALAEGDQVAVAQAEVRPGEYRDVGSLSLRPVSSEVRQGLVAASPDSATGISGRVVERSGAPIAGVRVLAFPDSRMSGKPIALSAPTGPDGGFRVNLPVGGTYFLGARSRLGGPAEPGEKVGTFRGEDGAGVRVAEGGSVDGVTIPVEEVW